MPKVQLNTLAAGRASIDGLNANFAAIQAAFDDMESLSGTLPNTQLVDKNMSGKRIINVQDGQLSADAVTLRQLNNATLPAINQNNATIPVLDLNELRTIDPVGGSTVQLKQHTNPLDGGGGTFNAVAGAASGTYVDNNGTIIVPTGGDGSAAWVRDFTGDVSAEWFGALGDGMNDDSTSIQAAIDSISSSYTSIGILPSRRSFGGGVVRLPSGRCMINTTLVVPQNVTLVGDGVSSTALIAAVPNISVVELTYKTVSGIDQKKINFGVKEMTISGFDYTNTCIHSTSEAGLQLSTFKNLTLTHAQAGFRVDGGWINTFSDIEINDCVYGFIGIGIVSGRGFNANILNNCTFQRIKRTGLFISGNTNKIADCVFQFDSYDALATVPANVPDRGFPVGCEMHGINSTTLGILGSRAYSNQIVGNYFEGIQDGGNGVNILLDNVDTAGGNPLLRYTEIANNYMVNNTDTGIRIINAYLTDIKNNTHVGSVTADILLESGALKTDITNPNILNIIDNSGGSYTFGYYGGTSSAARKVIENDLSNVVVTTTSLTLTQKESGTNYIYIGTGATGIFNLPTAVVGMQFSFSKGSSQQVQIVAQSTDQMRPFAWAGAATVTSNSGASGDSITVLCLRANQWYVVSQVGAWV